MGLDTTHGCWHGAYSAFMRWRCEIARSAGLPPLQMMEGFYGYTDITSDDVYAAQVALGYDNKHEWANKLIGALSHPGNIPIRWDCLKPSPLHILLNHSDCDGEIRWQDCDAIANELEKVLPNLPTGEGGGHIGNWLEKTKTFITGLRLAASRQKNVEFH